MKGLFQLRSPHDLLDKMRSDLEKFKKSPTDPYSAFKFFVTAEHMKDWTFPGERNRTRREALEKAEPLLQVCSHVANGAKHFEVEAKHHRSVADTRRRGGYWPLGFWASGYWNRDYWSKGALIVELTGAARSQLGSRITAVELAERVFHLWEGRPELQRPAK